MKATLSDRSRCVAYAASRLLRDRGGRGDCRGGTRDGRSCGWRENNTIQQVPIS